MYNVFREELAKCLWRRCGAEDIQNHIEIFNTSIYIQQIVNIHTNQNNRVFTAFKGECLDLWHTQSIT